MEPLRFDHPLLTIGLNVPDAICLMGPDFTIRWWNKGAEDMLGYTAEEVAGKNIAVIIPSEIARQEIEHCVGVLNRDGKMSAYESVRLTKDGRRIPVEMSAVLLKTGETVTGYASITRDITARKKIERELIESEKSLRTIFDSSNDAIFVHEIPTGRILEVNRKFFELYEYGPEDVPGLSIEAVSAGTACTLGAAMGYLQKAAAGEPQSFEWCALSKSGRRFPVEINLQRIFLRGNDCVLATVSDISARKEAEEELAKIGRWNELILESAGDGIFGIDSRGNHIFLNSAGRKMLGYEADQLLGRHSHVIWHHTRVDGSPYPEEECLIYRTARDGISRHVEDEVFWRADGSGVPVSYTTMPILEGTAIVGTVVTFRDITERREAERRLRESEEKFRSIVQTSSDWIWEMDSRGTLTFNNPAVEHILGYRPEELLGRNAFGLILEDDRETAAEVVGKAAAEKQGWRGCLLRWKHRDGTARFIESNSAPIVNEAGDLIGFRGSDHDLTELKRAEEQLKKAYAGLEEKVRERTRELARTNDELRMEVTERRRAVEVIRRSKELSDALNSLNAVLHSSLDISEILQRVVEEGAKSLKVDGSMIGLFAGGAFTVRHAYNMPPAFTERSLTQKELRGLHHAAMAKQTVAFNDAFNDERLNTQFVREVGIKSLIVAPFLIKNRIAGAMAFYGLKAPFRFDDEHVDFAKKLGASVSLALENARLYNALQEAEKLSASRLKQLQTIYDTAPVGLCFMDRDLRFVSINRRLAEINKTSVEETIGRRVRDVTRDEPEAVQRIETLLSSAIRTGKAIENVEIVRRATGGQVIVSSNFYPLRDEEGRVLGVNVVIQDITKRKQAELALRTSEQRLKAILNGIPDIAWLKDRESRFILVNDAFARSSGRSVDSLIGKTDFDVWPKDLAEHYRTDDREVMKKGIQKRVEEPLVAADGARKWIETIKTPIHDESGRVTGTVGISRDTTDRRRMEEEIRHMAQHDALTGLPNRRLFVSILNVELAQTRRHRNKLAVLFLDLDRFKEVNDTLGHKAGDELLKQVAVRLRSTVRETDTVSRIGGDEFNIILSDITRPEDVSDIALKIVYALRDPVFIETHELHITTSVGISIYPDDAQDIETLLRYADIAMYHAKESGKNTYRYYNPSIHSMSIDRMKMDSYLRQTIKRGELSVLYQPQVEINSKQIRYAEALVRWNHPERGVLEPGEFLPLAEETGFIASIDEWVLRTVCAQAAEWKRAGLDHFCVTVNLSARQFESPDLVDMIAGVLRESGLPADCLDLEVTENIAMSNVEWSALHLRELRRIGVHISIDDFGTGYSSLNYLKRLPIERLKIDKSFIRDIATDPDDRAIISAVTSMAKQMGMRTVAEGVETEAQLAFVRRAGCDEMQGFLVGRPVPAERFRELAGG